MSETSSRTLTSSLSKLNISSSGKSIPKPRKTAEPAESWEDEEASDSDSTINTISSPKDINRPSITRITSTEPPIAPPPTPASPSFSSRTTASGAPFQTFPPYGMGSSFDAIPEDRERKTGREEKRPEKSTAVASRLIAAGIGQAAPKRTAEQREYDRAVKVQEKKKRDQAKEEEVRRRREKEEALKAVWED